MPKLIFDDGVSDAYRNELDGYFSNLQKWQDTVSFRLQGTGLDTLLRPLDHDIELDTRKNRVCGPGNVMTIG